MRHAPERNSRRLGLGGALGCVILALLAGCATTEPATDVTSTSAVLNGKALAGTVERPTQYAFFFRRQTDEPSPQRTDTQTLAAATPAVREIAVKVGELHPSSAYTFSLCDLTSTGTARECHGQQRFATDPVTPEDGVEVHGGQLQDGPSGTRLRSIDLVARTATDGRHYGVATYTTDSTDGTPGTTVTGSVDCVSVDGARAIVEVTTDPQREDIPIAGLTQFVLEDNGGAGRDVVRYFAGRPSIARRCAGTIGGGNYDGGVIDRGSVRVTDVP